MPQDKLQLLGMLQARMLTPAHRSVTRPKFQAMTNRSIDWCLMLEDLPDSENRVTLHANRQLPVHWKPNNWVAHERLVGTTRNMRREAGYPVVLTETMGIETNSHQCGTVRFCDDPATVVLDPYCRSYDPENLYVVDSAFFPSSSTVNPALPIIAQALSVADRLI